MKMMNPVPINWPKLSDPLPDCDDPRCAASRQRFTVDHLDDRVHAGIDAGIEFSAFEIRRNDLRHDAFRRGVVQRTFQSVADFDAQLAVILGDEQQHAIVHAFAPQLPRIHDANSELFDGFGLGAWHKQNRNLRSFARLECRQLGFKCLCLRSIECGSKIGDAMLKRRERQPLPARCRKAAAQAEEAASRTCFIYFAGAALGAEKSTVGAFDTAFSSSTVNEGLTL